MLIIKNNIILEENMSSLLSSPGLTQPLIPIPDSLRGFYPDGATTVSAGNEEEFALKISPNNL
jgi:hypothetical protein